MRRKIWITKNWEKKKKMFCYWRQQQHSTILYYDDFDLALAYSIHRAIRSICNGISLYLIPIHRCLSVIHKYYYLISIVSELVIPQCAIVSARQETSTRNITNHIHHPSLKSQQSLTESPIRLPSNAKCLLDKLLKFRFQFFGNFSRKYFRIHN